MLSREILSCVFSSASAAPRLAPQIAVLPWQDSGCARRFHVLAICSRSMQQADPHILSYWSTVVLTLIHRSSAAFSSAAWILLLLTLLCIMSTHSYSTPLPLLLLVLLMHCLGFCLWLFYPALFCPSNILLWLLLLLIILLYILFVPVTVAAR